MQALAVHRDAAVAVEFFSLGWGRLVHRPAIGSLLVLLTAIPPGARGQARSQGVRYTWLPYLCSDVWGPGAWYVPN